MSYKLTFPVESEQSTPDLVLEMQNLYDLRGIAGLFNFVNASGVRKLVFTRDISDDSEFIANRVTENHGENQFPDASNSLFREAVRVAAIEQLTAELGEYDSADASLQRIIADMTPNAEIEGLIELSRGVGDYYQFNVGFVPNMTDAPSP